jgi:hypothetical protein
MKSNSLQIFVLILILFFVEKLFAMNGSVGSSHLKFIFDEKENSIHVFDGEIDKKCYISQKIDRAKLSTDHSALIVSYNSYISTEKLKNCQSSKKIKTEKIPGKTGFLVDINLDRKIYISLDFVSTQPMLYLATVARLGSSKNLVTLPGTYVSSDSLKRQQQKAFAYSEDTENSPRISKNGRYVSVDGQMDCAENSYPGVWDIQENKKVIIFDNSTYEKCNYLFK